VHSTRLSFFKKKAHSLSGPSENVGFKSLRAFSTISGVNVMPEIRGTLFGTKFSISSSPLMKTPAKKSLKSDALLGSLFFFLYSVRLYSTNDLKKSVCTLIFLFVPSIFLMQSKKAYYIHRYIILHREKYMHNTHNIDFVE
jgi:hypothetical protein